jgi:23S rRNA-/tRNA-specific pseudouridylate synthase
LQEFLGRRDVARLPGSRYADRAHLDRFTSGVLLVAKNDAAHRGLAEQFIEPV